MSSSQLTQDVINQLNDTYHNDFLNYEKCKKIYNDLQKEIDDIEGQVTFFSKLRYFL